jgi:flagellar hook-length control protein FliK
MTTTINLATAEPLNSATTSLVPKSKAATEGLDSIITEDSPNSEGSFLTSLEKLTDETTVTEETVVMSTDGNVLPVAGKQFENTAEDDRSLLLSSMNMPIIIQNDNEHFIAPVTTGEQSLILDNKNSMKAASEGVLLSTSIRQLLQADVKAQGQNTLTSITNSNAVAANITTDSVTARQAETSLMNLDNVVIASQKNPASTPLLTGQLPTMSTQQSLAMLDTQSVLLQQSSSALVENSSSLSPSLTPASGSLSSTSLATMPQLNIGERFGQPGWAQGMSKQIVWMTNQNINTAEIRLNPAHLGPIEVRIDIRDEVINVALSSRHAVVREAMETALPRLREMFDNNGMNLADADISQQSFAEQREQNTANGRGNTLNSATGDSDFISPDEAVIHHSQISTTVVDYYI